MNWTNVTSLSDPQDTVTGHRIHQKCHHHKNKMSLKQARLDSSCLFGTVLHNNEAVVSVPEDGVCHTIQTGKIEKGLQNRETE